MALSPISRKIIYAVAICTILFISGCDQFKRELRTEIVIDGTSGRVWSTLMDFEEYPHWNPMIRSASGHAVAGEQLDILVQPAGTKGMSFKPTVVKVDENRVFRWLGKLGVRGIFDGEHVFTIEPIDKNSVRFIHREVFSGVIIPLAMPFIADDTLRGFNAMNVALKHRVEEPE